MGRFSGMSKAEVFTQGSYFDAEEGKFLCRIKDVLDKDTRKSGPSVIVELEVVQSSNPEKVPVGAKKSWVQPLRDKDIAFPNLLAFIGAVCGFDPTNAAHVAQINGEEFRKNSEPLLEQACNQKVFNERFIWVNTRPHVTQAKPNKPSITVTRHTFQPYTAAA
jgi:hypothetical protein